MPSDSPTWEDTVDVPSWEDTKPFTESDYQEGIPETEKPKDFRRDELAKQTFQARLEGEQAKALSGLANVAYNTAEILSPSGLMNQPFRAAGVPDPYQAGRPLVTLPKPEGTGFMSGLGQLAVGTLEGLTTPEMLVTMPAAGASPVVRALFAGEMAKGIPESIGAAGETLRNPEATTAQKVVAAGQPLVSAAFVRELAKTPEIFMPAEFNRAAIPISGEAIQSPKGALPPRGEPAAPIERVTPEQSALAAERMSAPFEGVPKFEETAAVPDEPFGTLPTETAITTLSENIAPPKSKEPSKQKALSVNQLIANGEPVEKVAPPEPAQPIGMGAALEGEVATGAGADIYGIAERVRAERAKAGQVEGVPAGEGISAPDSLERGVELLKSGTDPEQALKNFEATKKLSADDIAVTRAQGRELALAARRIEEKFGTTSPEYLMAWKSLSEWDKRTKPMQTEWHKMGQAQQGEVDIDTGSFTGLQRAYREQTGKDFDKSQSAQATQLAERVRKANAEAQKAKETLYNVLDKEAAPEPVDPKIQSIADRIIAALDTQASKALERIKARRAEGKAFSGGIDPSELDDYIIYGASKLARGVLKSEWVKTMINDIGDYIKPHLDDIFKRSEEMANKLSVEAAGPSAKDVRKAMAAPKVSSGSLESTHKALENVKEGGPFTPQEAKSLWNYAKKNYIDKGVTNFDDVRHKVATDLGMSVKDVTRGFAQPKTARVVTNEMWKKQQQARLVTQQAKRWLTETQLPAYKRYIGNVPKVLFGLKVGFHGTVALGTHAPAVAFQPRFWKNYVQDFGKMYKMVFGKAFYEKEINDLIRRGNYITARRAGLQNDPFQHEDFTSPDTAKYLSKLTGGGNRGYAVLKILRQDMFDQHWGNLPDSLKTDPEVAKAIADSVNHATGVVQGKAPAGSNLALFAPRLEASRVMWLAGDPIRTMDTMLHWNRATTAQKHFAMMQLKEKLWTAGTLASLLALNQGFLSAIGSKQKINVTDPMQGDFLKFKVAGMNASYGSPLITMARLPARFWAALHADGKLSKIVYEDETIYKILGDYVRSQMSPFAGTAMDLAIGRDFQGRPLPRAGFGVLPGKTNMPKRLRMEGLKPYSWSEYTSRQFTPIPVSEGIKEVWEESQGLNKRQQETLTKALIVSLTMAATGGRLQTDFPKHTEQPNW